MKSIVQEASSIAKAVELGWQKAGRPAQFSVKVLELPEKNFFGFTTRSAKVALYFAEDMVVEKERPYQGRQQRQHREYKEKKEPVYQTQERHERQTAERPARKATQTQLTHEQPQAPGRQRPETLWNKDTITCAEKWLRDTLKTMQLEDVAFTLQPHNFHLRITLNKHLMDHPEREKQLLASFSALMMETLRKEFKTGFRGHKIVLTHMT